mmetsp:Transcript_30127/g.47938  ORF Transcript_30127/g.47938 Transcript_30127/m.47938 type:complete len:213 (+) Transcript_30127:3535-4173(+)
MLFNTTILIEGNLFPIHAPNAVHTLCETRMSVFEETSINVSGDGPVPRAENRGIIDSPRLCKLHETRPNSSRTEHSPKTWTRSSTYDTFAPRSKFSSTSLCKRRAFGSGRQTFGSGYTAVKYSPRRTPSSSAALTIAEGLISSDTGSEYTYNLCSAIAKFGITVAVKLQFVSAKFAPNNGRGFALRLFEKTTQICCSIWRSRRLKYIAFTLN